jgi:hypothetical protein
MDLIDGRIARRRPHHRLIRQFSDRDIEQKGHQSDESWGHPIEAAAVCSDDGGSGT